MGVSADDRGKIIWPDTASSVLGFDPVLHGPVSPAKCRRYGSNRTSVGTDQKEARLIRVRRRVMLGDVWLGQSIRLFGNSWDTDKGKAQACHVR